MKELIYLTGQIDSPFFTNEIGYFCKAFDKVYVLLYSDNLAKCEELAKKYGFSYHRMNVLGEKIKNLPRLFAWSRRNYVKEEKREIVKNGKKSFLKWAYILMYGLYAVSVERVIRKHLKAGNEIYLYSFWLSRPAFAIASMNYKRNKHIIRIGSRVHRYDLYEEENSVGYLPFRRFIAENLDTIYFSSKDTYHYYKSKGYSNQFKQAARKLSYLGTNEPEHTKKQKNNSVLTIASCAFIIQRKRLDLIIQFIASVAKQGQIVKWIHIGNGEMEEQIKKMANEVFAGYSVEYRFVGKLPDEEIYKLYYNENVDFFINMSDSEGIPVSVLEALSMGIPCIARNVGGNADAVLDGFDGMLIEKDAIKNEDLQSLAHRIISVFSNNQEYSRMSYNARLHWGRIFSGKNNIQLVCEDLISNTAISPLD